MFGKILAGQVVGRSNHPLRINQVADSPRQAKLKILFSLDAGGVVRLPDVLALIAYERERKLSTFCKRLLILDGIEGGSNDCAVCGFEFWGSITEPSTLARSTGC